MKKKVLALIVCVLLVVGILPLSAYAANAENIIILYENDVHCTIEGYSKLAAMKKD